MNRPVARMEKAGPQPGRSTRVRRELADVDGDLLEALVFLGGSGEKEGVGGGGAAAGNGGDDVNAADPVGLFEVRRRPLRRVVRMGVVEAGDIEPLADG